MRNAFSELTRLPDTRLPLTDEASRAVERVNATNMISRPSR
jgi:hypothetical protein